jgi:polyisoprenoid-binding protein YceI
MRLRSLRNLFLSLALILQASVGTAAVYELDIEEMHASIQFRIRHLGYSWLNGRFNDFSGQFRYDPKHLENASVRVTIDTASIDSNNAKRDKHLRDKDFLYVSKYPEARFVSTGIEKISDDHFYVIGNLTLRGITREISIETQKVGEGPDPWGGHRTGFSGIARIVLRDFGITKFLGPTAKEVDLLLDIEGIRQDKK